MAKRADLAGHVFGRLTAVEDVGKNKHGKRLWKCKCQCGTSVDVPAGNLQSGNTKSCGCFQKENTSAYSKTHGFRGSKLYHVYSGMVDRCTRENHKSYAYYGGRGIFVCQEWLEDRSRFFEWAMANGYKEGLTLDRVENDGPYAPDNCRWVDRFAQCSNTRDNVMLTYQGKTQHAMAWARELGLDPNNIWRRKREGWSDEDALTSKRYTRH